MKYLICFLGMHICINSFSQTNWILQRNENGIKIYTSTSSATQVKSVKAELQFTEPITTIAKSIYSVSEYSKWVYQCSQSDILKVINDSVLIYRHVTDLPWPFEDRDQVSKYTITKELKSKTITISSKTIEGYDEYKGYFRLKQSEARWELTPQLNGTVKAIYFLMFDPGGNIPSWLVNLFITDGPYQSFINLKKSLAN
jgi:hypothetical protein